MAFCKSSTIPSDDLEKRAARLAEQLRQGWASDQRLELVNECYTIGHDAVQLGATELAARHFQTAIDLAQNCRLDGSKESSSLCSRVAACHNHLGLLHLGQHRLDAAATAFDAAITLRRELRRFAPNDRENEVYLGGVLCNRGHVSADTDPMAAKAYYEESLSLLRLPQRTCECSYWDEARQSWWCEQLEAYGQSLNLPWISWAPVFIDHATAGLKLVEESLKSNP